MLYVATLQAAGQAWSSVMMILLTKEFLEERHGYSLQEARKNIRGQLGLKERFREGLVRSGLYLDRMKEIFRQHGLPEDLIAVEAQWQGMGADVVRYSILAREEDLNPTDDANVRAYYQEWSRHMGRRPNAPMEPDAGGPG